jgi:hypothetical protein
MLMNADDLDPSGSLGPLEAKLLARFSPPLRPEEVQRCLLDTVAVFSTARIRTYLPLLIERAVRDRLQTACQRSSARREQSALSDTSPE